MKVIEVGFLKGYDVPFQGVRPCEQVMLCHGGLCHVLLPDAEGFWVVVYIHWLEGWGDELGAFWLSLCWVEILGVWVLGGC